MSVTTPGAVSRDKDAPALLATAAEQAESTHSARGAGAAQVQVCNGGETRSSGPGRSAAAQESVRKHCPDIIAQLSTDGRAQEARPRAALEARHAVAVDGLGQLQRHRPRDPASLRSGARRRHARQRRQPRGLSVRPAMLYNTADLEAERLIEPLPQGHLVFGVWRALRTRRNILECEVAKLHESHPGSTWTAAGIGRHRFEVEAWALEAEGHHRTRFENSIRLDRSTLPHSDATLVGRAAGMAAAGRGGPSAMAEQAPEILGSRGPA
ncbi:MAG: 3-keto-5-aminohexanoate cleavage protein [Acetobacteraceae bacterium]|nr:3-keto-5-aminohexanoate cleavage protein [Acetobacteraceae bacterium]